MKQTSTLGLILAALLSSCGQEKEIQMNMTSVQLVRIDTIRRYPDIAEQQLTWRSENNIHFITYEPLRNYDVLGSRMSVMIRK